MKDAQFTIYGEPQGKGRPRFSKRGNYVTTHTPEQTILYENLVKTEYRNQGNEPFEADVPIRMVIVAYYSIPKSVSKTKRANMLRNLTRPMKKPDLDNVVKVICDSLNGIAYHDDSQITDLVVTKLYSNTPRVSVGMYDARTQIGTTISDAVKRFYEEENNK